MVSPGVKNLPEKLANARRMRKNPTAAEARFWERTRRDSLGFRMRRQVRMYGYIADFFASSRRLAIEIDGGYHTTTERIAYDDNRTRHLEMKGIKVVRFTNDEVFSDIERVVKIIMDYPETERAMNNRLRKLR